ncbi:hypothetical protein sos41_14990 [Alphaproteobacteria bacterium SO-S41]|nr:hypothetical protein sos41_14990 [Alphaproteobacteria bacterium SO-S41]
MSKFKTILVAGVTLAALSGAAFAGGKNDHPTAPGQIVNTALTVQWNYNSVYALTQIYAGWVGGDLRGAATAVGNNVSWETQGGASLDNMQRQLAPVGAELKATIVGAGSVDLSATAICNNVAASNSASGNTVIRNDQRCDTLDPYAIVNANLGTIGGDAATAATSVGNNLALEAVTAATFVYNGQINAGATYAQVNVNMDNVGGAASAAATAIGNNLTIKSGFGTP